jgi:hypothetical protein
MMTSTTAQPVLRYCGRDFTADDLDTIRRIADDPHQPTRAEIARAVCDTLGWTGPDGAPKLMSCRVALQRMEAHGVIWLPLPTRQTVRPRPPAFTHACDPQPPIAMPLSQLGPVHLDLVQTAAAGRLWNEYIARYHYRGAIVLPGAQLRYLAYAQERTVAAFGLGAAAWKLAPRDQFIGWTPLEREAHLPQIVDLHRFLILPWVKVPHLASHLLAKLTRRLPSDWRERYGVSLAMLETFVEADRFPGTSYAAANWLRVGQTKGRGRADRTHQQRETIKDIWLLPLARDFRHALTAGRLPPERHRPTPRAATGR